MIQMKTERLYKIKVFPSCKIKNDTQTCIKKSEVSHNRIILLPQAYTFILMKTTTLQN